MKTIIPRLCEFCFNPATERVYSLYQYTLTESTMPSIIFITDIKWCKRCADAVKERLKKQERYWRTCAEETKRYLEINL